MNKINLRYLFLYVLMAVFIAPAVANITRTFGVQPAELTQSQILYSDSIDYFLGGSLLLKNGQTDKYLFDGGYVRSNATTGNFSFFYYNKDHLGNNREVLDHRGAVRQVTSYYPFGAPYADDAAISGTGIQPYKYNGKELDLMHGLNTYDYGARQYYSILGRWDRVDPLAEKYYSISPYAFCANNPMDVIDIGGLYPKSILDFHRTSFYRADYYTFTQPAAHLLSLVSNVSEEYIRNVNIMEKGVGRLYPYYSNDAGGAITMGSNPYDVTMTFTKNYFADNPSAYNGNGYGQNVNEWLDLASHEVKHIDHVKEHKGKIGYLVDFGLQYLRYGHDQSPAEMEADKSRNRYKDFTKYINKKYGNNSLLKLFESNLSDGQKIQQIDQWWSEYENR